MWSRFAIRVAKHTTSTLSPWLSGLRYRVYHGRWHGQDPFFHGTSSSNLSSLPGIAVYGVIEIQNFLSKNLPSEDLWTRRQNPCLYPESFLLKHCITPCLQYGFTGPRIGGSAAFKHRSICQSSILNQFYSTEHSIPLSFINTSILQDILHYSLVFPTTTNHWTIKPNVKDEKNHHDLLSPYATGIFGATYVLLSFLSE